MGLGKELELEEVVGALSTCPVYSLSLTLICILQLTVILCFDVSSVQRSDRPPPSAGFIGQEPGGLNSITPNCLPVGQRRGERGEREEEQRKSREIAEEVQRKSRRRAEEEQRKGRRRTEEGQRKSRGSAEEEQKKSRGRTEEE
uniref:Uncharacterized protein n=1 Tax=Knipowitschia caucasica TaxID=637954 RepID=A0AAV2JEP7_KNICA